MCRVLLICWRDDDEDAAAAGGLIITLRSGRCADPNRVLSWGLVGVCAAPVLVFVPGSTEGSRS